VRCLAPAVGILKRNVIEKFHSGIPHIPGRCMNDCIANKSRPARTRKKSYWVSKFGMKVI